jgi:hypothetical protein
LTNKRFDLKKKKYMPVVIIDLTNVFLSKTVTIYVE